MTWSESSATLNSLAMTSLAAKYGVDCAHNHPPHKYLSSRQLEMASEESLVTLKILMIGPSGAGKSARKALYARPATSANTVLKFL